MILTKSWPPYRGRESGFLERAAFSPPRKELMNNYVKFDERLGRNKLIRIKTIVSGDEYYLEKRFHWLQEKLDRGYVLFFDTRIKRWMVYKLVDHFNIYTFHSDSFPTDNFLRENIQANPREMWKFLGKYVHILIVDDGELGYREPGWWLYCWLRDRSLFKTTEREGIKDFLTELDKPSTAEQNYVRQMVGIYAEINKDYDWLKAGRVSSILSRKGDASMEHKRRKRKKIIFVGLRTKKVLGVRYV